MLTVSQLAKRCKISRSTLLYYERSGIITPKLRSDNGYRWYGDEQIQRLEQIITYRSLGMSIDDISRLLSCDHKTPKEQILRDQLILIEQEIQTLRQQQSSILKLVQQPEFIEETMMTKQRWVEIMKAAGLSEQAMTDWHRQFERLEPDAHQSFLESLNIEKEEITRIRAWSKQ